jgi:hypothetical protein
VSKQHGSGCKCPDCHEGLAAYARDADAYEAALAKLRPVTLHVVTTGTATSSAETDCAGTMTCTCRQCSTERQRIKPQGHGNANPFRRAA